MEPWAEKITHPSFSRTGLSEVLWTGVADADIISKNCEEDNGWVRVFKLSRYACDVFSQREYSGTYLSYCGNVSIVIKCLIHRRHVLFFTRHSFSAHHITQALYGFWDQRERTIGLSILRKINWTTIKNAINLDLFSFSNSTSLIRTFGWAFNFPQIFTNNFQFSRLPIKSNLTSRIVNSCPPAFVLRDIP